MTRANGIDVNRHSGTNWNSLQTTLRFVVGVLVLIPMGDAAASPKRHRSAVDGPPRAVGIQQGVMMRDPAGGDGPPPTNQPFQPPAFRAPPPWRFRALLCKTAG